MDRVNTETVYVIEIERGETEYDLHYLSNGILIKAQLEDGNDNPYLPEQIPAGIESKVKAMYPNAVIIEMDRDNGNIEVDIIDQNIGKEVVFNSANEWIYTSWKIRPNTLPYVVKAVITTNYPDYEIDDVDFYETPAGNYYDIEVEKGDKDLHVKVSERGEILK